ncbi:hypothetical protein ABZ729_15675 [Streptomyces sp. NPDC006678]|uniref:hypothetical protein n=1 Tax=Streptomyces sp. NPDC006678 TaxID=3157185 RepID=UPI0033F2F9C4
MCIRGAAQPGVAGRAQRLVVVGHARPGVGRGRFGRPVAGGERAELERLRAEARKKDKRIRELEMERDVCKRFVALWVK